ncbi:hypothetical protein NE237_016531 [Protea cynaroides]|uniref:F-box domain-containing protein n=1 Tax=Protea cynaroides TaxID=273540 RepID=A0A9Q0K6E9_9MAGN|nr:hypothetical protein NE237_016531 [Protea cynaroides]
MAATDELLIPNLRDDIALQCIARVPSCYRIHLSLVSKSWYSTLRSPPFFSTRDRLNCTHHLLNLNMPYYNANLDTPPLPSSAPKSMSSAVTSTLSFLPPVCIFDSCFNKWEIGPNMLVERKYASAGVMNGKIYVMGGSARSDNWVEVLDPRLDLGSMFPVPLNFGAKIFG